MKLATRGILVVAAGAVTLATGAFGQEVKSEKVAPLQNLLPDSYGRLELRHELDVKMIDDTVANQTPNLSLRPTIGSKFFDGDLDTSFTWILQKNAESTAVKKTYFYNITTYNLVSGKYGSITPYAETYQTFGSKSSPNGFVYSFVGAEFATSGKIETSPGTITLSAYTLPLGVITSGHHAPKVKPDNLTGRPSLKDEEIAQRDLTIDSFTGASVKYAPTAVKGLSVALGVDIYRSWSPKYETTLEAGEEKSSLAGYDVADYSLNKFTVSYALTDKLSLTNQVRHYVDGIYERGMDVNLEPFKLQRWENRLLLTATLF